MMTVFVTVYFYLIALRYKYIFVLACKSSPILRRELRGVVSPNFFDGAFMNNDLPSMIKVRDLLETISTWKQLLQFSPTPEKEKAMEQIEKIENDFSALLSVPTLFSDYNQFFNPFGWHAHDSMALPFLREAIALANDGHIEAAESLIIKYYTDNFNYFFNLLKGIPTFFERSHILSTAKERFFSEDYISCVPLTLMMIDGMSNDVLNKGIFTDGADFNAWDCLASLNGEIASFVKVITKNFRKIDINPIDTPYRNGILHGLAVGYGNKTVAVKCWALIFVIRDILIKKINEPSDKNKFEQQQQLRLNEFTEFLNNPLRKFTETIEQADGFYNWSKSRTDEEWKQVRSSGEPDEYKKKSPEHALACFFNAWKTCNYGKMASLVHKENGESIGKVAGDFRNGLNKKHLCGFNIDFIQEERVGVTFGCTLHLKDDNDSWAQEIFFTVSNYYENEHNFIKTRIGEWLLNGTTTLILCHLLSKEKQKQ